MLVLSRKLGESVLIETQDGQIEVKVVHIERNVIKLGFQAPVEVPIVRAELLGKVKPDS